MKHRVNLLINEYEIRDENTIKTFSVMYSIALSECVSFPVIISTLSRSLFKVGSTGNFVIAFVGMNWNLFFVQNLHFSMFLFSI